MKQRNSSTRHPPQGNPDRPAAVIPLRRVKAGRKASEQPELSPADEGMAALARLLAEAWAL